MAGKQLLKWSFGRVLVAQYCLLRGENMIVSPGPKYTLEVGDTIVVVGSGCLL